MATEEQTHIIMNAIAPLIQRVEALEAALAQLQSQGKAHSSRVQPYRKTKPPPCFVPGPVSGREARWASWSFSFGGYFAEQVEDGEDFLEWAAGQEGEVDHNVLDDFDKLVAKEVAVELDAALYRELRQLCVDGEALTIVRNQHRQRRGAEAWRKLCQRFRPGGEARVQVLEDELALLTWPTDEADAGAVLDAMEDKITEWEKLKGRAYPEDTKKSRLVQMLPEKYRTEIAMNPNKFPDYTKVSEFALRMVHVKRQEEQLGKVTRPVKVLRDQVNNLQQELYAMWAGTSEGDPWRHQDPWLQAQVPEERWRDEVDQGDGGHEEEYEPLNLMKGGQGGKGGSFGGKGWGQGPSGSFSGAWQGNKGGGKGAWKAGGKGGGFGGGVGKGGAHSSPWQNYTPSAWTANYGKAWPKGKKGPKGGGKGFAGKCRHCGEWGHTLKECKIKDAEMARWRAASGVYIAQQQDAVPDEEHDHEHDHEDLFTLVEEGAPCQEHVCTLGDPMKGWIREPMIMDSGASSTFLRKGFDHLDVKAPEGKDRGRKWSDASGGEITHRGESRVKFFTEAGARKQMTMKRSDRVQKTIGSVSEIADKGNFVIFTKKGGAVVKDPDMKIARRLLGQVPDYTPFKRENNVYTMDLWMQVPAGEQWAASQRTRQQGSNGMFVVDAEQYQKFVEEQVSEGFQRLGRA